MKKLLTLALCTLLAAGCGSAPAKKVSTTCRLDLMGLEMAMTAISTEGKDVVEALDYKITFPSDLFEIDFSTLTEEEKTTIIDEAKQSIDPNIVDLLAFEFSDEALILSTTLDVEENKDLIEELVGKEIGEEGLRATDYISAMEETGLFTCTVE